MITNNVIYTPCLTLTIHVQSTYFQKASGYRSIQSVEVDSPKINSQLSNLLGSGVNVLLFINMLFSIVTITFI